MFAVATPTTVRMRAASCTNGQRRRLGGQKVHHRHHHHHHQQQQQQLLQQRGWRVMRASMPRGGGWDALSDDDNNNNKDDEEDKEEQVQEPDDVLARSTRVTREQRQSRASTTTAQRQVASAQMPAWEEETSAQQQKPHTKHRPRHLTSDERDASSSAHGQQNQQQRRSQGQYSNLPIMPHSAVLYPGEDVSLQLSSQAELDMLSTILRKNGGSAGSNFPIMGCLLNDTESGRMENVGVLIRIRAVTHMGPSGGAILTGEAEGRFKVNRLRRVKPFILASVDEIHDILPVDGDANVSAGVVEERVWQRAREARALANTLYAHMGVGDLLDLSQTRLWRPSVALLEPSVITNNQANAAYAVAKVDEDLAKSGECDIVWGGQDQDYSLQCEARRRQRFSFALARALELDLELQQLVLRGTSTTQRLLWLEKHLDEGIRYLRARLSVKSVFTGGSQN